MKNPTPFNIYAKSSELYNGLSSSGYLPRYVSYNYIIIVGGS